jgi:CRISP-associated protein Cas1
MSLSRQALTLNRLKAAFAKVKSNSGAPGVDGITPSDFGKDLIKNLKQLQTEAVSGIYHPQPLRRAWLRREGKSPRALAIPTVRDRVLQTALAQVLTPLFEAEFEDCSYAYRQGRSVRNAIDRIGVLQRDGYRWVVDADIEKFFDNVPHARLAQSFAKVVPEPLIQNWIARWIAAPILDGGLELETTKGIPQGSPISPMLSNLYLDHFDETVLDSDLALVRYADDFVILTKTQPAAEKALALTEEVLHDLALGLNPLKTKVVNLADGLDYLGWHLVGSFAIQKARRTDPLEVNIDYGELPSPGRVKTLSAPKFDTKYTRLSDKEALVQHYLRQNDTLENPALASGLLEILPGLDMPSSSSDATTVEPSDVSQHAHERPALVALKQEPPELGLEPTRDLDQDTYPGDTSLPPAKPLQRTLYLIEQGSELGKEGEALVVRRDGDTVLELPASQVDLVVLFGNIAITTSAIQLAMRHQITIALLSKLGRYYGRIDAGDVSALNLQQAQAKLLENAAATLDLARAFVQGKLGNSRVVLGRYLRRRPEDHAHTALLRIRDAMQRTKTAANLESLRGLEGAAAVDHFAIMRSLIGDAWGFHKRERQPPPDAINALLSLGYTLLYQTVAGLIQARGLNPHLGFFHAGSGTHLALASDLMEEFRAFCVDAVVLNFCLNLGVEPGRYGKAYEAQASDVLARIELDSEPPVKRTAFQLERGIVKQFVRAYEERLNAAMQHPISGETGMDLRRIIDGQVLQLVRVCRDPAMMAYQPCVFR